MDMLDSLFTNIRLIVSSLIIKYDKKANVFENIKNIKKSDQFVSASLSQDSFNTYKQFDQDVFIQAGITDLDIIETYMRDKNKIPPGQIRKTLVELQRKKILESYTEDNNYYRMLNGMPDVEDDEFIFLDDNIYNEYSIPILPIHLIDKSVILILENTGVIDELIKKYPNKKYLKYMGKYKIELIDSRTSKNFSLLYMTKDIPETLYNDFYSLYEQCREYFMSVIYIKEFSNNYDLYDNFISLMILVMTIQKVISKTFKNGVERDFYDLSTLKLLFESYDVPYIYNLPIELQRALAQNLNGLLRFKSTDKVIYDLCSLLGFEHVKLFKYFLVKKHVLDVNENPLFFYKEVDDGQGGVKLIEDKEKMYKFYFQTVELKERNTALALQNTSTVLDYNDVTLDDPYWVDDDDLKTAMYETEFNYIETKYLSMNIMYKMSAMLFEGIYAFKLMIDKKSEISNVTITLPKLFSFREIKLFDSIVLLFALLSKKNGFAGNILVTPTKILSVLGFNFKNDFQLIRETIRNNSLIDQNILSYLEKMNIQHASDINALYTNIKNLNDFLTERMNNSQSIAEYRAYQNLFKTLMISEENKQIFRKSNGEIAETFSDYLSDSDIELFSFLENVQNEKISEHIEHILSKINELVTSLQYLCILNDSNNIVFSALIKLIRFFKSYTTDLRSFNILYLMDSRYFNMIRLVNDIKYLSKALETNDSFNLEYSDITKLQTKIFYRQKIQLIELFLLRVNTYINSSIITADNVALDKNMIMKSFYDLRSKADILKDIIIKSSTKIPDNGLTISTILTKELLEIKNLVNNISENIIIDDIIGIEYSDVFKGIESDIIYKNKKTLLKDEIKLVYE